MVILFFKIKKSPETARKIIQQQQQQQQQIQQQQPGKLEQHFQSKTQIIILSLFF